MKKIQSTFLMFGVAAALGSTAMAQQLPNVGFDSWKGTCGSSEQIDGNGKATNRQRPGDEPAGWEGSSVYQVVVLGVSKPVVFKQTENDNNYVQLQNKFVGVGNMGSVAPGFINFGTPWVYASMTISECDGGTYGGMKFTARPDGLKLDLRRIDENDENSTVIAYLWNGTFKSKVGKKSDPNGSHDNVDRAIMGRITPDAGSTGKLIASLEHTLKSTANKGWETLTLPFEYKSDEAPEMANVIVCSGDYWTRDNMKDTTELHVDNVGFYYNSRLESLSIDGVALDGFAPDTYAYTVSSKPGPATYTLLGEGKSATAESTLSGNVLTVKVRNANGNDIDGKNEHVYTVTFAAESNYAGYLNIAMNDAYLAENQDATVEIVPTGADACTFRLPNFTLAIGDGEPANLGTIEVKDVKVTTDANGTKTYKGAVKDMELLGGEIKADVTVDGEITSEDVVYMSISVVWNELPIAVTFSTNKVETIAGYLNIEMGGEYLAEDRDASIELVKMAEEECIFRLPNFTLAIGDGDAANLGTIEVKNVKVTTAADGTRSYKGSVKDMELLGGEIKADVTLDGTINAKGVADMKIGVLWNEMPINVTFTTDKVLAIEAVEAVAADGTVEYFNLNGVKVNGENLPAGIYVRRQGNNVNKVIVK